MAGVSQLINYRDRRLGFDRRNFSYTGHVPERRSGNDRRFLYDRRTDKNTIMFDGEEQRAIIQS